LLTFTGVIIILLIKILFPISVIVLICIAPISVHGQVTPNNGTIPLNNANTLAKLAPNISNISAVPATTSNASIVNATVPATTSNASIVNATTVVNSVFETNLPIFFLAVIAAAMVIPLSIDMVLAYIKKPKQDTLKENGAPAGMPGLYRTLMAFGIILLVGTVIFYVLALTTLNINNPTNPVLQSLVDILKNLSTILGTALATIIAFYFGMRGAESAAEKAETRARGHATDKTPPTVVGTTPADGEKGVAVTSPVTATFGEPMLTSSINKNTFTVKKDGTTISIDGTVTLGSDGKTSIFDPTNDFDSATKYIATISTEAKDLAGNALPSPKSWSFTTL
jgi:Bacterial Ig-like domain